MLALLHRPLFPQNLLVHHSPHTSLCSLVRTHTLISKTTLTLGCQTSFLLCAGLLWFTLIHLSLFLKPKKPPSPPHHHIIARYGTGAVQHSAAPCILSRPRSIRPLLLSLPPHPPTPLFFQRRFLPFAAVLPSWP